jgi:hypothetical protein
MSFLLLGILNSQAAGGGGGAYDLLETTTLTTSASSITFSGLSAYSSYKSLQIRMVVRDTGGGTYQLFGVRLNSDTASSYAYHILYGNGSSVDVTYGTAQTSMNVGFYADGGATSGAFGAAVIDVLDFSSSSKNTTLRCLSGVHTGGNSRGGSLGSGLWNNTNAVTDIEVLARSTSFAAGSRFSLIGIK